MLGDDSFSIPRVVKSSNTSRWLGPLLLVAVVKSLRYFAISQAYTFLHDNEFPVLSFVWFLLLVASAALNGQYRPFSRGRALRPREHAQSGVYALLLALNLVLVLEGVKYYGALRSMLTIDYSDLAVAYLCGALLGRFQMIEDKVKGATVMIVAYLLIFLVDDNSEGARGGAATWGSDSHSFYLGGLVYVPERFLGGAALSCAILCTIVRKSLSLRVAPHVGAERLFAVGCTYACGLLTLPALYQLAYAGTYFANVRSPLSAAAWIALIALLFIVLDKNIELFSSRNISSSYMAKTSVAASFAFALGYNWLFAQGTSLIAVVCFLILLLGMYLFFSEAHARHAVLTLPLYIGGGGAAASSGGGGGGGVVAAKWSTSSFLRVSLRQVLDNDESRSIFYFLLINLAFMFVEFAYGLWTNSLGLISDSFHMLFDCTALVIGLYAEVISKWDATRTFSYGYSRSQVLGGFVNGIFLVFVAIFVLWESLERFMEPPEINTDRLLLVSFLGLVVNCIGLFSFQAAHEAAHKHGGGGDGHSHSHSHGHSHGHSHEQSGNFNIDGVFLHVLADTIGSVGVLVSTLLVQYLGWTIADPICSFCIAVLIFVSVIPLVKGTSRLLLLQLDGEHERRVGECLQSLSQVAGSVQLLETHFWMLHNGHMVGTLRVQVSDDADERQVLHAATSLLGGRAQVQELCVEVVRPGGDVSGGSSFQPIGAESVSSSSQHHVITFGSPGGSGGAGGGPIPLFSPDNPLNPSGGPSLFNVITMSDELKRDGEHSRTVGTPSGAVHRRGTSAADR